MTVDTNCCRNWRGLFANIRVLDKVSSDATSVTELNVWTTWLGFGRAEEAGCVLRLML